MTATRTPYTSVPGALILAYAGILLAATMILALAGIATINGLWVTVVTMALIVARRSQPARDLATTMTVWAVS